MSLFKLVLIVLLLLLQYRIWFGENSLSEFTRLSDKVTILEQENVNYRQRNKLMEADIIDLDVGLEAIEERARNNLGMIKQGEVFYRIVPNE